MSGVLNEDEAAVVIPSPPYFSYDSDSQEKLWTHLEDALLLHRAARQLHRDRYSSAFQSLAEDQQRQRTALLNISFKIIDAAAHDSLCQAIDAWLKAQDK